MTKYYRYKCRTCGKTITLDGSQATPRCPQCEELMACLGENATYSPMEESSFMPDKPETNNETDIHNETDIIKYLKKIEENTRKTQSWVAFWSILSIVSAIILFIIAFL